MGYNTACIILNDSLHRFATDTNVGEKVQRAILTAGREGVYGPHGFKALPSQHADTTQIVAVGGNSISILGYGHWTHEPAELLRQLADQMGYRIVKKATRDRDASSAEDAKRLSPEGVAARPEGIAR